MPIANIISNFILLLVEKRRLINGHKMMCPRCKREHSVEQYLRLEEGEEFKKETVPVYKCPECKWIFALATHIPQDIYDELEKTIADFAQRMREKELVG